MVTSCSPRESARIQSFGHGRLGRIITEPAGFVLRCLNNSLGTPIGGVDKEPEMELQCDYRNIVGAMNVSRGQNTTDSNRQLPGSPYSEASHRADWLNWGYRDGGPAR